ncbi:MAG: LEA type 2 family protein [Gemmatimonadales bacterium]
MIARFIQVPHAIGWLVAVLACTPVGVWIYEDPRVTVARVRLDVDPASARPVLVALNLRNPNDYVVSTTRVELRLALDDLPIGRLAQDSSLAVPKGTATIALPLVPDRSATRARLQALNSGVHRFAIEGQATFTTPVGKRRVRFAQTGELAFGSPSLSPASAPPDPAASP